MQHGKLTDRRLRLSDLVFHRGGRFEKGIFVVLDDNGSPPLTTDYPPEDDEVVITLRYDPEPRVLEFRHPKRPDSPLVNYFRQHPGGHVTIEQKAVFRFGAPGEQASDPRAVLLVLRLVE